MDHTILLTLLSGGVGAFFATLFGFWLHNEAQRLRRRQQLAVEVIAHFEEIYNEFLLVLVYLDDYHVNRVDPRINAKPEYIAAKRRLGTLVKSRLIVAKILVEYGEGDYVGLMNAVLHQSAVLYVGLFRSSAVTWNRDHETFKTTLDQIMQQATRLQDALVNESRPITERKID